MPAAQQQPSLLAQDDIDDWSEGLPHHRAPRHTRVLAAGIATAMIVASIAFLGHRHGMVAERGSPGEAIVEIEADGSPFKAGRIHWQHHPEYCVVASDEVTDSGHRAVVIKKCAQWNPEENDTKKWDFPDGGVGNIRWHQDKSLCLHGGSAEGESVVLWDCGDDTERANMKFSAADGRGVGQVTLSDTSMCIDVNNEKMEDGVKLVMSACAKGGFDGDDDKHPRYYQQIFYLPGECSYNPAGDTKTITWTNWMLPQAEADRHFSCLAGSGSSEVTMQNCSGGDAEKFQFPVECNMGMIKNVAANKCLRVKPSDEGEDPWVKPAEADGAWSFDGVKVDLWDCSDTDSMEYMLFIPPYSGGGGSEVYPMGGSKLKGPIRWSKYPWNCIEYSEDETVQLSGCPEHHPLPAAWAYWFTKVFVIPN